MSRMFRSAVLCVGLFLSHPLSAQADRDADASADSAPDAPPSAATPPDAAASDETAAESAAAPQERMGFFSRVFGGGEGQVWELEVESDETAAADTAADAEEGGWQYEVDDTVIIDETLLRDSPAAPAPADDTATRATQEKSAALFAEDDVFHLESTPAAPEAMDAALAALEQGGYNDAFRSFRGLAGGGDAVAMYQVGAMYHRGLGTGLNYAEAARWYLRAAERGNADAQYRLGGMFLMGEGVSQDDERAEYWYQKAAEQGHGAASHNLSRLKKVMSAARRGDGAETDADDAMLSGIGFGGETVINEVAEAGIVDSDGMPVEKPGMFARMFGGGDDKGKEKESQDARAVVAAAAEQQQEKKPGFFRRVFGGGKDKKEAPPARDAKPGQAADGTGGKRATPPREVAVAEQESPRNAAAAEVEQVFAAREGAVPGDDATAAPVAPAAETGAAATADQDYEEGLAYALGDGVDEDPLKALERFRRAAERGHAGAQYQLGLAYAYGKGTERNPPQAADWYQKAAVKGHLTAQRNIGMMYLNGEGVETNRPLALAWYSILAEGGSPLDGLRRDLLSEELSRAERDEAKKLQDRLQEELQTGGGQTIAGAE